MNIICGYGIFLILLGITLFSLSIYDTQLKSSERTLKKLQNFQKALCTHTAIFDLMSKDL